MKEIAVVVCNNGLGHIKRVLWVLKFLYDNLSGGIRANVFVDLDKIKYFPAVIDLFGQNKWSISFQDIKADIYNFEFEFIGKYKRYLEESDYIWSDNLLFPLKYRKEVFITGSFLWFDVINDGAFVDKEIDILAKNKPVMIGNRYFATPNVRKLTTFFQVGLYKYGTVLYTKKESKGLLVSCGKSKSGNDLFKRNLHIVKNKINEISKEISIYVESDYHKYFISNKNVLKASFTEEMFANITAASVRPGFGTISDLLLHGGRIFAFYEDNNFELEYNSKVIVDLKIGENNKEIGESIDSAVNFILSKNQQANHLNTVKKIDFNGLDETLQIMKDILV
jgi:hypothetical protein